MQVLPLPLPEKYYPPHISQFFLQSFFKKNSFTILQLGSSSYTIDSILNASYTLKLTLPSNTESNDYERVTLQETHKYTVHSYVEYKVPEVPTAIFCFT